jgi:hypothetical protein
MDMNEIDLEFMEQEPQERLTHRDALFFGFPSDSDRLARDADANTSLLEALN